MQRKPSGKSPGRGKPTPAPVETIRLNKYISQSGLCSRREADTLIAKGKVSVNGKPVLEVGTKVLAKDKVQVSGKTIKPERKAYVLLNKPKDFITTMTDPEGRKTVMDLIKTASEQRVYPVGRLDRNTTGLLLFTNDGELAEKLTHPSYMIKKIYQVDLDKPLTRDHFEQIQGGLTLEDGPVKVDEIAILDKERKILGVEIHLGRNRIVRRIFEHLGYDVKRLDRVMYGPLTKKDLPRGKWRLLEDKEIVMLTRLGGSKSKAPRPRKFKGGRLEE
jgi:23S rRNA pseudouridine2605 synthase